MHFGRVARIAVVGVGAALTVGLGSGVAMADMANGDPPVCQVEPNSSGCTQGPTGSGGGGVPGDWVADQFSYFGTSYLGEDFYVRNDLGNATSAQTDRLARDLGYTNCRVVWVMNGPNEGACK